MLTQLYNNKESEGHHSNFMQNMQIYEKRIPQDEWKHVSRGGAGGGWWLWLFLLFL